MSFGVKKNRNIDKKGFQKEVKTRKIDFNKVNVKIVDYPGIKEQKVRL